MAFTLFLNPEHIHIESSCVDHRYCSESHWKGGRPQIDHPHHVEIDINTGLVGYTRLTQEEIEELKKKEIQDGRN